MTAKSPTGEKANEPFLSRWARVKHSQRQEMPVLVAGVADKSTDVELPNTSSDGLPQHKTAEEACTEPSLPGTPAAVELPSLDSLTPQSDFSPFMAKDVDRQLRNQAMKKLFTDPHYNIMDRLDTYIDDYSVHTPLPLEVIRQMNIAKTLGLFDDEETTDNADAVKAAVPVVVPQAEASVVQGPATPDAVVSIAEGGSEHQVRGTNQ